MPKISLLLSMIIFIACTNQSYLQKEIVRMNNFETYIKQTKWSLPPCKKSGKNIVYLKDKSKVEYSCCDSNNEMSIENIFPKHHPFIEIQKTYYCDTKTLKSIYPSLKNLAIGSFKVFDKQGNITKEEQPKLGKLDYNSILKWANKEGFIDFKNAKILKGSDFDIEYYTFQEFPKAKVLKDLFSNTVLSESQQKELFSHKGFWIYKIENYSGYGGGEIHSYILSDGGIFITKGKIETVIPADMFPQ